MFWLRNVRVCVGFVMCGCVCIYMCWFCNLGVCVFVGFVMCVRACVCMCWFCNVGCVYLLVL